MRVQSSTVLWCVAWLLGCEVPPGGDAGAAVEGGDVSTAGWPSRADAAAASDGGAADSAAGAAQDGGAAGVGPVCGDGTCGSGESCSGCPADCGACPGVAIGAPCEDHEDCGDLICVGGGDGGSFCTSTCLESCPDGFVCTSYPYGYPDLAYYCLPDDHCQPSPEVCDGVDNDCDGKTDEPLGPCKRPGKLGACQKGTLTCADGIAVCETPAPQPEKCNGQDDDCDGEVDDGHVCAVCGDSSCHASESCQSCPQDCGDCSCGGFECPCDEPHDCDSGLCIPTESGAMCTIPCVDECPDGYVCEALPSGADLTYVCRPE